MWTGIRLTTLLAVMLVTLSTTVVTPSAAAPRLPVASTSMTVPVGGAGPLTALRGTRGPDMDAYARWPFPRLKTVNFDHGLVPVHGALDFVFDRPIGETVAETSVQITPTTKGVISWPDRRTLRFQPQELLFNTRYEVSLVLHSQHRIEREDQVNLVLTTEQASEPGTGYPYTLTFDDCGTPGQVAAILDALSRSNQRAIFFPTGICRDQNPGLVATLIARGHRVGNHTYSHPQLTKLSNSAIAQEISGGVSTETRLFRPPYGDWDGPYGRVARIAAAQGYQVLMWDVDTRDWAGTSGAAMDRMIHARGGIVLMHMHGAHTVEAIVGL